jgi:hypothetical protein
MSPRKRKTIWDCDASELAADSAPAAAAGGGGGGGGVICDAQDDEAHCEAQRDSLFKDPGRITCHVPHTTLIFILRLHHDPPLHRSCFLLVQAFYLLPNNESGFQF